MRTLIAMLLLFLSSGCLILPDGRVVRKAIYPFMHGGEQRGTCFWLKVGDQTRLVTAKHVVTGKHGVSIYDEKTDVAILDTVAENLTPLLPSRKELPLSFRPDDAGYPSFPVTVRGFVDGERVAVRGHVCAHVIIKTGTTEQDYIFTTVDVKRGMSGSPLLDADGKVLGLFTHIMETKLGTGKIKSAFVPVATIIKMICPPEIGG